MKNKVLFLSFLVFVGTNLFAQGQYTLQSPNQKIIVTVNTGERLSYAVMHENTMVLAESPIAMTLDNGQVLGVPAKVRSARNNSIDQTVQACFYKRNEIRDCYNELTLSFKGNYTYAVGYDPGQDIIVGKFR